MSQVIDAAALAVEPGARVIPIADSLTIPGSKPRTSGRRTGLTATAVPQGAPAPVGGRSLDSREGSTEGPRRPDRRPFSLGA